MWEIQPKALCDLNCVDLVARQLSLSTAGAVGLWVSKKLPQDLDAKTAAELYRTILMAILRDLYSMCTSQESNDL